MSEPLRAISLFSGAGGMDVGFENAGIKVVFANELVSDAAETYKANHPDCIMVNDDINNVIDSLDRSCVWRTTLPGIFCGWKDEPR